MIVLPKCVAKLVELAGDGASRPSLGSVRIEPPEEEGGSYRLVATDGASMGIVQGGTWAEGDKENAQSRITLESVVQIEHVLDGVAQMDVESWRRMWSLKDKVASSVALLPTEKQVAYALGHQSGQVLTHEGRYPDYMAALPKRPPILQVRFGAIRLAELCRVAASVAGDTSAPVIISFYGPGQPLGFMARNENNGVTFDGMLMPLS